jgi:hypothetical protein
VIIQFPSIAESVASDLGYIRILLDKTLAVLPTPLFFTVNGWN